MTSRFLSLLFLTTCTTVAGADIFGVKTSDPLSGPPSTLFAFDDSGTGPIVVLGVVTRAGLQIDVDGLAIDAAGNLYGFELQAGPTSRLLSISTADATASPIAT